jgi:hypothetical protein
MAEWWLARWEATLDLRAAENGQLEITVRAEETRGLDGPWIEIFLPGNPEDWVPRFRGELMRHLRTEWGIRVPLTDVAPGAEMTIELADAS